MHRAVLEPWPAEVVDRLRLSDTDRAYLKTIGLPQDTTSKLTFGDPSALVRVVEEQLNLLGPAEPVQG